jgi:hypothetical protein
VSTDQDRPDFEALLDWLEGRLEPDAAAVVAAQVAGGDERTRGTVEWLRGFLAAARALPLHEPPPIVRQSLIQCFARWSRARAELDQEPRLVQARLLFDSRQDVAAAGMRAVAPGSEAVHLAYTTEDGDLLLDVYDTRAGRVRLEGQVLLTEPRGAPVFEASVTGPDFTARTRDGDALGRFSLPDVPKAACRLRASNGVITIVADVNLDQGGTQP